MSSSIPNDRKYAASHEWARVDAEGIVTVGITDHAQTALGDVVFVELPEPGTHLDAGDPAGVVESVKAASDIYAPVSGEVIEVNEALEGSPELVNAQPHDDGWFYRLRADDLQELDALFDADGYAASLDDA
jgi:glycine cleavage system H protein